MDLFRKLAGISGSKKIISDSQISINEGESPDFFNGSEEENEDNLENYDELSKETEEWLDDEEEGQLSIDVFQTEKDIVVKSTIAGVRPEDIDISVNNDMLTIRGKREMHEQVDEENYIYRECYWGNFSRTIILPVEVDAGKIDAFLENGVLTVTLPKSKTSKQVSIKVKEK